MRVIIDMVGTTQLVMHNVQLADPTNSWAKAIAEISHKRKKTDEDRAAIARLEFMGGLYMGKSGPVVPTANVHRSLVLAAKMRKEGKTIERALLAVAMEAPLQYDGPRDPEGLWAAEQYRLSKMVRVGAARVLRTRPRFPQWRLITEWELLTDKCDVDLLGTIVKEAGLMEGLGDGRSSQGWGRFDGTVKAAIVSKAA